MCLREIGAKFGVSRERVRQIEAQIVDELRAMMQPAEAV
jgi:DNA-directed RNA polymerase sigma subunit (sigma70/sigma32)